MKNLFKITQTFRFLDGLVFLLVVFLRIGGVGFFLPVAVVRICGLKTNREKEMRYERL